MFETLTKRLSGVFSSLGTKSNLTETDVTSALREIRIALLEADVALPVVKSITTAIKEQATGEKIIKGTSPSQQVAKIVHDEIVKRLGGEQSELNISKSPSIILMAGLQGSGKTTSSGKLALHLKEQGKKVLMASADVYRPAAREQLKMLGEKLGVDTLEIIDKEDPINIAKRALKELKGYDVLIFDTAGRTQLDDAMMNEIALIEKEIKPDEVLLCVDAMTGQESVNVAKAFHDTLTLTGIIMTRADGDARGGAALSMKEISGAPIKFTGIGEKPEDFEIFYPDRLAQRILGMGDVVTLVEQAQKNMDEDEVKKLSERMMGGEFDFNDMLAQMQQMKKMGSMGGLLKLLPGMSGMQEKLAAAGMNDDTIKQQTAIIQSMTKKERKNPNILLMSRKERIAKGSGATIKEVEKLIKQYEKMKKTMKQMQSMGGISGMMEMMKNMKSGDGGGFNPFG